MRFAIVVDMQRDFVAADGALPVPGAQEIVGPVNQWLAALRPDTTAGVLFTADTHVPAIYAVSEEAKQFPPHCEVGTPGWALVVDPGMLDPAIPAFRLEKSVFDMWSEPGLLLTRINHDGTGGAIDREGFFAALRARGVEEVEVVGVAADYCVRWAVEGLVSRGFRVTIPPALTRGIARPIDAVAAEAWQGLAVTMGGGGVMTDDVRLSKRLSLWLRHRPEAAGLILDAQGWTEVDLVLAAFARSRMPIDWSTLLRLVEESDKQRFELSADGSRIRARQGHSVPVELDWPQALPPPFLYHGTVDRFLPAILKEGLRPMRRHHVHLSPDLATATRVAARRGTPVILTIRAGALAASGQVFLLTGNGVWLTDHVPPSYLMRADEAGIAGEMIAHRD